MTTTELTNLHQSVVARRAIPGLTAQIEECWLANPRDPDIYTCYSQYNLSLTLPRRTATPCWTRFLRLPEPVPGRLLVFDPPAAERQTHMLSRPPRDPTVSCYFDCKTFHGHTDLTDDWNEVRLKACYTIDGELMTGLMRQLYRELSTPGFASDMSIESIGHLLLIEIARHFQSQRRPNRPARGTLAPTHLARIREYLEETHSGARLTTHVLADLCGLNADHLRRAFRNSTGQSLGNYIEQVRLAKAHRLLREGRLTLKQIAYQLGFASAHGFSQAFKRQAGLTPKEYHRGVRSPPKWS